jgi:bla regulator protein BlaR1
VTLGVTKGEIMGTFEANLAAFLQWLLKATLQGSLLVCLIMLIKGILRERLPARWHYCLWLVLLIRLALPWAPQSRISIYGLIPRSFSSHDAASGFAVSPSDEARAGPDAIVRGSSVARTSAADQAGTSQSGQGGTAQPSAMQPLGKTPASSNEQPSQASGQDHQLASFVIRILAWVWLAGGVALAGYILLRAFALWRAVTAERPVTDQEILDLLEDCKMQMRVRTLVGVVVTDKVKSPALFGFIRPRILLPQGLIEALGLDELQCVFLHELAHLRRRDIYLAWLVCLLQVLHWFNPLIWFAFRRMRADQEMAADALALSAAGTDESRLYGRTIVNLLERFSRPQYLPSLAGILENPSHIERRIAMITQFKNSSYRWSPLAFALVVMLCCVSLPDARSGKAAQPVSASVSAEQPAARITKESNVFVDPNTGITFRKAKTLSGPSDVIESTDNLQMSPNGKFLLSGVKVIPLDGSQPFNLMELPRAVRSVWSPDGKRVLLVAGAIWVVVVNPETGRPTGPAEKLYEGNDWVPSTTDWYADSERVAFVRSTGGESSRWTLSVSDKSLQKVSEDPSSYGETRSPDGKKVALISKGDFWVKSTVGTEAKMVADAGTAIRWSADSEWLLYTDGHSSPTGHVEEPRFFRVADGRQQKLKLPAMGTVVGTSADRKKLFYYCASYDRGPALQVASVSGGPTCQLGGQMPKLAPWDQFWSPDSGSIVVPDDFKGDDAGLLALPLSGTAPVPLRTDVSVPGKISYWQLSPSLDYLLFCVSSDDKTFDIWGASVSWQQMRTTGPAALMFKNWSRIPWGGSCTPGIWSPDGKKIAILQKGEIWLATPAGGEPTQLKVPKVRGRGVFWSPDSSMIAFYTPLSAMEEALQVVSASGSEAKTVAELTAGSFLGSAAWSPDSKAMTIAKQDGQILSISIADGQSRPLVDIKDLDKGFAIALRWSPDGKILAFKTHKQGESYQNQLLLFHRQDGRITKVADEAIYYFWSPDSKWISYMGFRFVKARPAGVLWEMDVEEAIAKLGK